MPSRRGLAKELKTVASTTLFFAAFYLVLILLKSLVLEEYRIRFSGVSIAIVGALLAAKAVIVLEHVPLLPWVERSPAWVQVLTRTALYGVGVLVLFMLERAFETRHERGGFVPALIGLAEDPHWPQLLAASIAVSVSLLAYNVLCVVRRHVGHEGLRRMMLEPLPSEREHRAGDAPSGHESGR